MCRLRRLRWMYRRRWCQRLLRSRYILPNCHLASAVPYFSSGAWRTWEPTRTSTCIHSTDFDSSCADHCRGCAPTASARLLVHWFRHRNSRGASPPKAHQRSCCCAGGRCFDSCGEGFCGGCFSVGYVRYDSSRTKSSGLQLVKLPLELKAV
jgi:hypothetical protein